MALAYDSSRCFRFDGWAAPEQTVERPEAADLLELVRGGQRVFVDGPRRCGKTTLVINTLEQAGIPVHRIDLDGVASAEKLIERIAIETRSFLDKHPAVRKRLLGSSKVRAGASTQFLGMLSLNLEGENAQQAQGIERSLDSLLSVLVEIARSAKAAIFIDEFQAIKSSSFAHPGEILGSFAAASDPARTRGEVPFIFAGSNRHQMHQIFSGTDSQFFQRTKNIPIGPIAQEAIIPFLNFRLDASVPPEVGAEAYRWTEGIPGDLQRLYSALKRTIGTKKNATMEDLHAAQKAVLNDIGRSYQLSLHTMPEDQLLLLDAITKAKARTKEQMEQACASSRMSSTQIREALQGLMQQGLLHFSLRTGEYERPEPILFHYLAGHPAIMHHPFGAWVGPERSAGGGLNNLRRKVEKKRRHVEGFQP